MATPAGFPAEVKVAVLDFDNTLWDQVGAFEKATTALVKAIVSHSDRPPGAKVDERLVEDGISIVNRIFQVREHPDLVRHHPVLHALYRGSIPERVIRRLTKVWRDEEQRHQVLYPGAKEMLQGLRAQGIKIVVYSECNAEKLARRLREMGVESMVDAVYSPPPPGIGTGGASTGNRAPITIVDGNHGLSIPQRVIQGRLLKSHPDALLAILNDLGVAPAETVMVGDNPVRDVAMAQAGGVRGIFARYGYIHLSADRLYKRLEPRPTKGNAVAGITPDAVINDPRDLLPLLKGPTPPAPPVDRRRLALVR